MCVANRAHGAAQPRNAWRLDVMNVVCARYARQKDRQEREGIWAWSCMESMVNTPLYCSYGGENASGRFSFASCGATGSRKLSLQDFIGPTFR